MSALHRFFRHSALVALAASTAGLAVAGDSTGASRTRGYFCDAREDQIAFLGEQAGGSNEIIASNAVNKSRARQTCAYYMSVSVLPGRRDTVFADGLVFQLESFIFLPERVERWSGTAIGVVQQTAGAQDI